MPQLPFLASKAERPPILYPYPLPGNGKAYKPISWRDALKNTEQFGIYVVVTILSFGIYRFVAQRRFRRWRAEKRKEIQPQEWSDEIGGELCDPNRLCAGCHDAIRKSSLFFGGFWAVTPKSEILDLHGSLKDLRESSRELCHLCCLLWDAILPEIKESIPDADQILEEQIRLKIFEGVPGSVSYSTLFPAVPLYMQVYRGEHLISRALELQKIRRVDDKEPQFTTTTNTTYHFKLAKSWIEDCTSSHERCLQREPRSPFPTRLVYVGKEGDWQSVHLHETSLADHSKKYLALSHCWGLDSIFTLKNKNITFMHVSIPFDELPRNFREAIVITQRLGFSYIWIDSLCIIQDSADDWASESAIMDSIYNHAFLTIAATGSTSSSGGCFHPRNPPRLFPCTIANSWTHNLVVAPTTSESESFNEIEQSPLNQRAWVFQERLLSQRILHFGKTQLLWECCQLTASEFDVAGTEYRYSQDGGLRYKKPEGTEEQHRHQDRMCIVYGTADEHTELLREQPRLRQQRSGWQRLPRNLPEPPLVPMNDTRAGYRGAYETLTVSIPLVAERAVLAKQFANILGFHLRWFELVRLYSHGHLTRPQDKLVAIAGVARKVQRARKLTYQAGMWKEYLLLNLLWCLDSPSEARPHVYRAPTWSWAAVDGHIQHRLSPDYKVAAQSIQAHILDSKVIVEGNAAPDTANLLTGGSVQIEGTVCAVARIERLGGHLLLLDERENFIASFLPDVVMPTPYPKLYCLKIAAFKRKNKRYDKIEAQGLVVRMKENQLYERVGFFSSVDEWGERLLFNAFEGCPLKSIKIV